jgi:hypothetical protein
MNDLRRDVRRDLRTITLGQHALAIVYLCMLGTFLAGVALGAVMF